MSPEASRLTIDVQEGAHWRRTLAVTIPADVVSGERAKIARTLATRLKLPGFRSGRIPAAVVEKRYGPALNRETVDRVVGDAYHEALKLEDLHPISEGEVEDLNYEPDQDLSFRISFDIQPEIELARLGGFAAERISPSVGDEEVEQVVERLCDQHGSWAPAEGVPENGDLVAVSVTRLEDGEPVGEPQSYDLVLGDGDAIPDVEAALATLAPGEEGEFTVRFPDDFPNEERRGEEEQLVIAVRERKIRELPALDDEFARSVGDFEDLASLRNQIRENLLKEATEQAEASVRGQILSAVVQANAFEVPGSMLDRYLDSILGEPGEEVDERLLEARERLRPEAEHAVKRILVIDRIAETQSLGASEDDLDARVEEIAGSNDSTPAEVYARLQKAGRLEQLEREITERKVFEFLLSQSEITEAAD
jgi:trigger factor